MRKKGSDYKTRYASGGSVATGPKKGRSIDKEARDIIRALSGNPRIPVAELERMGKMAASGNTRGFAAKAAKMLKKPKKKSRGMGKARR
jgi:hypothetical protein